MEPLSRLGDVLSVSDIVVLTLPLTEQTRYMMNAERFTQMKDSAVLVNIARGGIVDTEAMIKALRGKLFGAVLDVFEEEPLSANSDLWNIENVILTPHNSFVGNGNTKRLYDCILSNLIA